MEQGTGRGGSAGDLRNVASSANKALGIHRWVPWVAGFSAEFVEDLVSHYIPIARRTDALVLDPFAGVGTTLVEALKAGCSALGYEINAFAAMAASLKLGCISVQPDLLEEQVNGFNQRLLEFESQIDDAAELGEAPSISSSKMDGLRAQLPNEFHTRVPFFSATVELKFLFALEEARALPEPAKSFLLAALGATMVSYSNYSYEPSLSSRPGAGKPLVHTSSVVNAVSRKLADILSDIRTLQEQFGTSWPAPRSEIRSRSYFSEQPEPHSASLLITSPPYMNNYHYVRNTRPQLQWLGLVQGAADLRALEKDSFGKFWQTVRYGPSVEMDFDLPGLTDAMGRLKSHVSAGRASSGLGWANYVASYFNDAARFLKRAAVELVPGAHAVVVVGNSVIQGIEFKVDALMAEIAERAGMTVEDVRIVRTRRIGDSLLDSSVRAVKASESVQLYDAALFIRA